MLRWHAGARPAWEQLRADLDDMGVEPTWGHRIGGRHAREVWEDDAWSDLVAEGGAPAVTAGWRGSLDQVAEGSEGLDLCEGDWEALLRREYGTLLMGDRGDVARCEYGPSRSESWGGAEVWYVTGGEGKGDCRGRASKGERVGGQDRGCVDPLRGLGTGAGLCRRMFAAAERELREASELEAMERDAADSDEGEGGGRQGVPPVDWDLGAQLEADVRAFEEERGYSFDAIASTDGGWVEKEGVASRAALLVMEGDRVERVREMMREGSDNYDAEMAARMEVLHRASVAGARRILVFMDATSPVDASRAFRRRSTRSRARRRQDTWLGSIMVMEDEFDVVVYSVGGESSRDQRERG